jgi:UMF1 family MFS transporter
LRHSAIFVTAPDITYLLAGLGIGLFVTAHYASSRTLLTRLVDPEKLPAFFGLYSISGTATVWLGSLLIKVATERLGTQQAGFIPIVMLLTFGLAGVWFVRGGGWSLRPGCGTDSSPKLQRPEAS